MRTLALVTVIICGMAWQTTNGFAEAAEFSKPVSLPLLKFANEPGKPIETFRDSLGLLAIHYGDELDPDRFRAKLNGVDVTGYFHPRARSSEPMELPFAVGSNRLEFDVWRVPRQDLPESAVLDNELHRLEVIVRERPQPESVVGRLRAVPPAK